MSVNVYMWKVSKLLGQYNASQYTKLSLEIHLADQPANSNAIHLFKLILGYLRMELSDMSKDLLKAIPFWSKRWIRWVKQLCCLHTDII